MIPLHFIDLDQCPIFHQLELEEALLRGSTDNYCIVNRGSPPAIVLGISGKIEELVNTQEAKRRKIECIRRFSGGGTVVVDENTLFITFIFNKDAFSILPYPEPILRWSGALYQECWDISRFRLIENDYAIGNLKCGGNAQYIKKDRWLHHTSFLWDYSEKNMNLLLLPKRRPQYRDNRSHSDFLCRLKHFASSKEELIAKLYSHLQMHFSLTTVSSTTLRPAPHRKTLSRIDF